MFPPLQWIFFQTLQNSQVIPGPTLKNPWSTLEHTGSVEQVQARISSASHWLAAHSLATLKGCLVGHPKVAQQCGGLLQSIENGYLAIATPTTWMRSSNSTRC